NREVLCKNVHETIIDSPVSSNHTIAEILLFAHAEVESAMFDELVDFLKGILVEEKRDSLARTQFTFGFLAVETVLASSELGRTIELEQMFDAIGTGNAGHSLNDGDLLPIF